MSQEISLGRSALLAMAMARYALAQKGWSMRESVGIEANEPRPAGPRLIRRCIIVDVLAFRPLEGYNTACKFTCELVGQETTPHLWEPVSSLLYLHGDTLDTLTKFQADGITADQLPY